MISPDQAIDFLSKMDSSYYGVVADRRVSEAFRDIQEMIEEYQAIVSDVLYYQMVKCPHCGHYTMPEDIVCHTCSSPLPVQKEADMNG